MIIRYFLGAELFVLLGYILGAGIFPKRYPLVVYKFVGVLVYALTIWYLAQFSGDSWMRFVIPASVTLFFVGVAVLGLRKKGLEALLPSKETVREFVTIEVISAFLFFVLVYLRTFKPDIIGTEKLMDVAIVNTLLKQGVIPIENPWLSGMYMNYYYFGHFILALLQYIANVPSAVGYNLAISLYAIWILQAGYVVARSLRLSIWPALATSAILTFGGNFYLLIQSIFYPDQNQWFASATRVIPFTINEFPAYSIVLGDLHGHYLSYPFFLLGIFLLVDIFFPEKTVEKEVEYPEYKSIFLGLLVGALYLTNSWDVLTLALLGAVIVFCVGVHMLQKKDPALQTWARNVAITVLLPIIMCALPQYFASRMYYLPPVGGIGFNKTFSNIGDWFMLFGQFLTIFLATIAMFWVAYKKFSPEKSLVSIKTLLPILLIWIGVLLVLAVELVYAEDVFTKLNPPYARTNTVFKIYYHAWAFFSLGTIAFFFHGSQLLSRKITKLPWLGAFQLVVSFIFAVMVAYSYLSFKQYVAPRFVNAAINRIYDPTLSNGYAYMVSTKGEDYDLISHLLTLPYAHISEIVTYDSYSYYARVSAYTGLSTVTGWPLHNVQWYNGYDGSGIVYGTKEEEHIFVYDRVLDVETLYTTQDPAEIERIIKKYQITYVIFGHQERAYLEEKKKESNIHLYKRLCDLEWNKGESYIFRCSNE